ncbi:precorrin-3B synthase [Streptomyces boluensis]|nr:precorrin-3B synthase [Streptomyces boluensis]
MSSPTPPPSSQATAVSRDRGDACPGSLRLHAADDGALARVRIPGGVLTAAQAGRLADAARELGDGEVHLTSRGNVQLRGLDAECGSVLATLLDGAGLLPSAAHERVRNVVASPLSGLDGRGFGDVRPWLTGLDAALCASTAAVDLSGRFLFALDDGRGDVAGLDADVTVRAVADGGALLALGRSGPALHIADEDAPRAALLAAETFLTTARASTERAWRVDELHISVEELTELTREHLTAERIPHDVRDREHDVRVREQDIREREPGSVREREPGRIEGPQPGVIGEALSVHVPLGRLTAPQWQAVTRAAEDGNGELRLTPWRGVVLPAPEADAAHRAYALARLAATGLVTDPDSPWLRVGACVGRPGCAKSHADVRADAARALDSVGRDHLPLYWSGCERRCGHPRGERIDLVATPDDGYRLSASGHPGLTVPLHDPHDPSQLATALVALTDRTA